MKASKFTDEQKAFVVKQGEDQLSDQGLGNQRSRAARNRGEFPEDVRQI